MAQLIQWREALEVGHPMIDADHKVLVGMLNSLLEAVLDDRGNEILAQTLDGLVVYTRTHFAREEKEMRERNYPEMVAHVHEHAQFIREVAEFQVKFTAGDTTLSLGLTKFLRVWLIDHILTVDKKLSAFLNA